jgi:uncharacterized protein
MKRVLGPVFLALLVLAAAGARAAPPAAKPAPISVELARYVLPEENWNRTLDGITRQTAQYLVQMSERQGAKLPQELVERMMRELAGILSYAEIVDLQASVLATHYTEPELKALLAFYKTPLGQKTIRVMPEIAQDVNGQMMTTLQSRIPAVMERFRPELEKAAKAHKAPAASERPAATP